MKTLKSSSIFLKVFGAILATLAVAVITHSPIYSTDTTELVASTEESSLNKAENHSYFSAAIQKVSGIFSASAKTSVLPGTNTAVVNLSIDKNGYPQSNLETVTVVPGQKIVFVGPDQFDIIFKDQRSPIDKLEIPSSNGTVIIEIPKDIFEREQRTSKETIKVEELLYRYGIRANGKVTDPHISVCRC